MTTVAVGKFLLVAIMVLLLLLVIVCIAQFFAAIV